MTGAESLAATLRENGVTLVFGLPGEENLDMVAAFNDADIEIIVTRHEQHAAFMAATYGRLTGRPGVCMATLGPGATNLLTGLAHAQLGGWPVLAITGQKPLRDNDEGSFQVIDVVAMAKPVTKSAVQVTDASGVATAVNTALISAMAPRAGATLVELPEDVMSGHVDTGPASVPYVHARPASTALLDEAAAVIGSADRPILVVSWGAQHHSAALTAFAEHTGIGVVPLQLGKGAIAADHPLAMQPLGIHRLDYAHLPVLDADLVVVVGYDPAEHPPLAWNPHDRTSLVHVAAHPPSPEPGYRPATVVVGDVSHSLEQIATRLDTRSMPRQARMRDVAADLLASEHDVAHEGISPLEVVSAVRDSVDRAGVVALDNGAYKIWFARHYPTYQPNTLLLDNALATMGAGLATGMTAALLDKDRTALVVTGDGGFMMNLQDLETAIRLRLDMTVLVVRDDAYGFIAWHQKEQGLEREDVDVTNPDIVALAQAFGAGAMRIESLDQLGPTLERAIATPGVTVVDCAINYSINDILETDLYQRAIDKVQEGP
ncbi:MAG: acetolactate synthase large subunit [Acidimicrobiia bacterium]|nr:acetolactate synthase large subunit [Acidimicrobiia bacterium]